MPRCSESADALKEAACARMKHSIRNKQATASRPKHKPYGCIRGAATGPPVPTHFPAGMSVVLLQHPLFSSVQPGDRRQMSGKKERIASDEKRLQHAGCMCYFSSSGAPAAGFSRTAATENGQHIVAENRMPPGFVLPRQAHPVRTTKQPCNKRRHQPQYP